MNIYGGMKRMIYHLFSFSDDKSNTEIKMLCSGKLVTDKDINKARIGFWLLLLIGVTWWILGMCYHDNKILSDGFVPVIFIVNALIVSMGAQKLEYVRYLQRNTSSG